MPRVPGVGRSDESRGETVPPHEASSQQTCVPGTDAVVFIAKHLRETITETVDVPASNRVIYNPVDAPSCTGLRSDSARFVTASTLAREKGLEVAIRAVASVDGATPEVFGDGPQRESLTQLTHALGCSDRITFHGRVPTEEVYRAITGATATIFPSLWAEPFGRVTVESMQLGTPVVGSGIGGIAEVVDDGETGLLFEPGNVESLAAKLKALLGPEELIDEEATRHRGEQFRPNSVVQSHLELYRDLLDSNVRQSVRPSRLGLQSLSLGAFRENIRPLPPQVAVSADELFCASNPVRCCQPERELLHLLECDGWEPASRVIYQLERESVFPHEVNQSLTIVPI